ncbi:hypothetical protein BC834DRAFT_966740 [Gloeopeniophorella convolvens]|nr:hypothetical protein BC834DRAFT_966740 [Gloeopeniophorella convolvens]
MWNGCHSHFPSLEELVSHVNLSHLSTYLTETHNHNQYTTPSSHVRLASDDSGLSCQWGNCHEYSSVGISSGSSLDNALNMLTGHLLHDHLGLQAERGGYAAATEESPTVAIKDLPDPAPEPHQQPRHQFEARSEDCLSGLRNAKSDSASSGKGARHRGTNVAHGRDEHLPQGEDNAPHPVADGPEKCRWHGCGLSFATVDDLTSHLTNEHVGSGRNHYECFWDGCERSGQNGFTSKQKVCRHLQMHTGHKPFQCKLCKQHFSEAATLQQHMRRHTQEKPYLCDVPGCGKAFAIAGALTIHKRTHVGLKPFKCKYCDRAFSESSNLSKHMRTHTGVRPYVCEETGCGKAFARPDQLTRHQGVHLKQHRTNRSARKGDSSPDSLLSDSQ